MARGKWYEHAVLGLILTVATALFTGCLLMILLVPPAD